MGPKMHPKMNSTATTVRKFAANGVLISFCAEYEYYDDEDDGAGDAAEDQEGQALWLREHHKKRRWKEKEEEIRSRMKTERELALKLKDKAKGKVANNIFTSEASSRVLTSDLLAIMREAGSLGFYADAVDDNIYHWKVKLDKFDKGSALYEGMNQLQADYQYDHVELELNFTIDLYPFYPPLIKVIRPRFEGFMMGRIASMEILQLSKWNPIVSMKSVIGEIKSLIQHWARVAPTPRNDPAAFPEGSYTELEYLLMRLGLVQPCTTSTIPISKQYLSVLRLHCIALRSSWLLSLSVPSFCPPCAYSCN